jgi:large subunit ribosomal protein L17
MISFIQYGKITTTKAKAQSVIGDIDHLVNLAKKNTTSSTRLLYAELGNNNEATKKLTALVPKFASRNSGYVRIIRLPRRLGDGAAMARLEWVDSVETTEKKVEKSKKKPAPKVAKTKEVKSKAKAK